MTDHCRAQATLIGLCTAMDSQSRQTMKGMINMPGTQGPVALAVLFALAFLLSILGAILQ